MGGRPYISLSFFLLFLHILSLQFLAWTQAATNVEDSSGGCSAGAAATGSASAAASTAATGSANAVATGSRNAATAGGGGILAGRTQKRRSEDMGQHICTDPKDCDSWDAIKTLHHLIDDDRNGNVDQTESDEFLRMELQYTDGFERHTTFHGNDRFISVEDLYSSWKHSEVYNWTTDDVVDWLVHHVELEIYAELFKSNKLDGPTLPRIAANYSFLGTIGIKNQVHKQKISLKAMDVVLFGAPKKGHSYIKDLALVASLIIAVGGCWLAVLQHRYAQAHVRKMMHDWESLQRAEESLRELQERLDKAQHDQPGPEDSNPFLRNQSLEEISRGKVVEEELKQLRAALKRAEQELEGRQGSVPCAELQKWLQLTYEIELQHHNAKKLAAEQQLIDARDCCEKLRKKRNAFMGPLRIAHGNSIDEVDKRILNARAALEEVRHDLQERLNRWRTIERLCNFPITKNPGMAALIQRLQPESAQGSKHSPSSTICGVDDEDDTISSASGMQSRRSVETGSTNGSPDSDVIFHLGESPVPADDVSLKSSSSHAYSLTFQQQPPIHPSASSYQHYLHRSPYDAQDYVHNTGLAASWSDAALLLRHSGSVRSTGSGGTGHSATGGNMASSTSESSLGDLENRPRRRASSSLLPLSVAEEEANSTSSSSASRSVTDGRSGNNVTDKFSGPEETESADEDRDRKKGSEREEDEKKGRRRRRLLPRLLRRNGDSKRK